MATINDLVPTTITYGASRGVPRRTYASPLLLTSGETSKTDSTSLTDLQPVGRGKVARISSIEDAERLFRPGAHALDEARNYFAMRPVPRGPLYVGLWNKSAVRSAFRGDAAGTLAEMKAITSGAFTFNGYDFTALDLSSATNETSVATALATKLNAHASITAIAVVWEPALRIFRITEGTTGGATEITSGWESTGTGVTGDTTPLGFDTGFLTRKAEAETISQALRNIRNVNRQFQTILADELVSTYDNIDAITTWAATQLDVITPLLEISDRATLAQTATSDGVRLSATQREAAIIWRGVRDGAMTKLASFYGSLRLNQGDPVRSPKGLELTGSLPDDLTADQEDVLRALRINMYVPLGETQNILQEGHCLRPRVWLDTRIWLGWFINAMQSTISRLILGGLLTFDAVGAETLKTALESVCKEGVRNRGISPGNVGPEVAADIAAFTGAGTHDGNLLTGYQVEVSDPNLVPIDTREERIGPAARVWARGSNRIHNVPLALNVIE